MTAVTIHTTERLGEKCNFLPSVELQKKGEEKEWTRQNYLPATTRACGNYYNDVSESRHSQCRDHTGADQKIKNSGATVISLRYAKDWKMTERSALSSRWREVDSAILTVAVRVTVLGIIMAVSGCFHVSRDFERELVHLFFKAT